jgi:preprotein translocase subunit Sss1
MNKKPEKEEVSKLIKISEFNLLVVSLISLLFKYFDGFMGY